MSKSAARNLLIVVVFPWHRGQDDAAAALGTVGAPVGGL